MRTTGEGPSNAHVLVIVAVVMIAEGFVKFLLVEQSLASFAKVHLLNTVCPIFGSVNTFVLIG